MLKRKRTDLSTAAYHDRVVLEDDFEVIHTREAQPIRVGNSSRVIESQRSPQRGRTSWSVGSHWMPEDNTELALDPNGDWYDEALDAPVMEERPSPQVQPKKKKKHTKVSTRPTVFWKERHRETYLDELIRWEGRGDARSQVHCVDCVARKAVTPAAAEVRCLECFGGDLVCPSCCCKRHRRAPFHRVERWTGTHFVKASLKDLGLKVQLNHVSMQCPNPEPCHVQLRVLHTNGIHDVALQYCGCRPLPRHIQLLRRGLFPASQLIVKTCATFQLLRQLHLLGLTTKASTYDFYRTLEKLTDNTGLSVPKSRYRPLQRMCLQWRHLVMLKRGGRGHDPAGAAGTKEGELAVPCLTCPHPGKNLPEGWEKASKETRFLYTTMVAMDANFRLKQQLVSSYSQDPGLGTGLSYMVRREPYEKYVLSKASQGDISTCVGFAALSKANTKFSKGLRYTGVAAVSCSRGEVILPCGVGDLIKGERYPNMDYVFASAMQFLPFLTLLVSYDIACQWIKNFYLRMEGWPDDLRLNSPSRVIPAIPKLHEPAHKETHDQLSFNHILGAGLTDGECPERIWAGHNALGNSTKTMGPGSRHDALDDHFGFWNWLKYSSMGKTLMRRYKAAVRLRNIQVEGHRGFTASMPPDKVDAWRAICVAWEEDTAYPRKAPSPLISEVVCISEAEVRKELAEEEKERVSSGGVSLHEMSASAFLVLGLDLEDSQRRIRKLAITGIQPHTSHQGATLAELRNSLRTKLKNWELLRAVYMPGLLQFLHDQSRSGMPPTDSNETPEQADLWLPSQLPQTRRDTVCSAGLPAMEAKLRVAQCYDALEGIRHVLRLKTRMVQFRNANIRGQRGSTRSRTMIDRVHERARAFAQKYRTAREQNLLLSGAGEWEEMLRPLEDGDIRAYTDPNRLRVGPGRPGTLEDDAPTLPQNQEGVEASDGGAGQEDVDMEEEGDSDGELEASNPGHGVSLLPEARTRRDGTGATRRELSWIWRMASTASNLDDDTLLCSEWAKSRARANRASEEVLLLREEMRRALAFLQWKGGWWRGRTTPRDALSKELAEGIQAYALSQATLHESMALSFRHAFRAPLEEGEGELQQGLASVLAGSTGGAAEDEGEDDEDDEDDEDEFEAADGGTNGLGLGESGLYDEEEEDT
ncbi:hypothetical protein FPV67DRAFT_1676638 [Lyophyllum atratum]|nr:hypothetical protein FPV67DRAFT_1676638 [Lyophyllum atratum]